MNILKKLKGAVLSVVALLVGITGTVQAGLINTSPIDSWEGAGAIYNNAGGGGVMLWFLILLALMLIVIIAAVKAENDHEREHG